MSAPAALTSRTRTAARGRREAASTTVPASVSGVAGGGAVATSLKEASVTVCPASTFTSSRPAPV